MCLKLFPCSLILFVSVISQPLLSLETVQHFVNGIFPIHSFINIKINLANHVFLCIYSIFYSFLNGISCSIYLCYRLAVIWRYKFVHNICVSIWAFVRETVCNNNWKYWILLILLFIELINLFKIFHLCGGVYE